MSIVLDGGDREGVRCVFQRSVLRLATQAEALDQSTVTLDVVFCQVLQQTLTTTNQQQQAAAGVVIVLVELQVLGQGTVSYTHLTLPTKA